LLADSNPARQSLHAKLRDQLRLWRIFNQARAVIRPRNNMQLDRHPALVSRLLYSRLSSRNRSSAPIEMNAGGRPERSLARAGAAVS
jgi:hypothetical protein